MGLYDFKYLARNGKLLTRNSKALYSYEQGLYSIEEIDALIADGYIPVASANELDSLRTATLKPMGVGTRWVGHYLTGLDKKYVQVGNIDFGGFVNWDAISIFTGIYDGNELVMKNLVSNISLFGGAEAAEIKNMMLINFTIQASYNSLTFIAIGGANTLFQNIRVYNSNIDAVGIRTSSICGGISSSDNVFNDIEINTCIIKSTDDCSGIASTQGGNNSFSKCSVKDSIIETSSTTGGVVIGGIIAQTFTGDTIDECTVENTEVLALSARAQCGGVVGQLKLSVIATRLASINNTVITDGNVGGAVGWLNGATIENSYSKGGTSTKLGTDKCGGLVGQITNTPNITNCYSTTLVDGSGLAGGIGGLVGSNNPVTITNSYYDTQTSGQSDTVKGEPRTTEQLQQGTADSFILPGGGTDPDNLPANSVFATWSNAIWNFLTNIEYPKLR